MPETIRINQKLYDLLQYLKLEHAKKTGEYLSYNDLLLEALQDECGEDDECEDEEQ